MIEVTPWVLFLQLVYGSGYERKTGTDYEYQVCSKSLSEVAGVLEDHRLEIHFMAKQPHIISTSDDKPKPIGTFLKTGDKFCATWMAY